MKRVNYLCKNSKIIIKLAENWSYILWIPRGRPNPNTQRIDAKYQLNPMLSPKWDLPISRRGDVRLNNDLVEAIFGESTDDAFKKVCGKKLAGLKAPKFGTSKEKGIKKRVGTLAFEFDKND